MYLVSASTQIRLINEANLITGYTAIKPSTENLILANQRPSAQAPVFPVPKRLPSRHFFHYQKSKTAANIFSIYQI